MIGHFKQGFPFPPRGWPLVLMLALFVGTGLIGHDPWKNDDALTIGVSIDMLWRGHWLTPFIADRPYPDAPLYYWIAAIGGALFGWLLPLHDAIRMSSALWVALSLWLVYRASRELHAHEEAPHEFAIASVLALAGCLGLLVHAHEAQPMLVALAAHCGAYWAFALQPRKPDRAAIVLALSFAAGLLGNGLAPMLGVLPLTVFAAIGAPDRRRAGLLLGAGLAVGLALAALWPAALYLLHPEYFHRWRAAELAELAPLATAPRAAIDYLAMSPWFAWPALPLALWTLRSKRRQLREYPYMLPLGGTLIVWATLSLTLTPRSTSTLLLLPPLALLAAAGVATLRRGAANAFDWFGIMTFSVFAIFVWVGWSAMVFGWPERLAGRVVALAPGFSGEFRPAPFLAALFATALWGWLIFTGQEKRSPWRGLVHWLGGLTTLWLLLMTLWLPWIEHGRSYRSIGETLRASLPENHSCVLGRNFSDANRALIDYYAGIAVKRERGADADTCRYLLVLRESRSNREDIAGWIFVTDAHRPSERREHFTLYRRAG